MTVWASDFGDEPVDWRTEGTYDGVGSQGWVLCEGLGEWDESEDAWDWLSAELYGSEGEW